MGFFSSLFQAKNEEEQQQKADQKNFDILKYDGVRAQRLGKTEYATRCFTEALKIQKDLETMKFLMSAYYTQNKHDDALAVLHEMVETGEEPVATRLMRANLLFTMERYAEAAADCEAALEADPDNYVACFQWAKSEYALGETSQAIGHLNRAIALKDDFADAYYLRADIRRTTGKPNEALADIGKLIELTPDDESAYLLRGHVHELMCDYDAAFVDFHRALELNPFNEEAWLLAGSLLILREKYIEAIALLDEAIEHHENFEKAYTARAVAKRRTGDDEGAAADAKKANELNPEKESNPEKELNSEVQNFDDLYKGNII